MFRYYRAQPAIEHMGPYCRCQYSHWNNTSGYFQFGRTPHRIRLIQFQKPDKICSFFPSYTVNYINNITVTKPLPKKQAPNILHSRASKKKYLNQSRKREKNSRFCGARRRRQFGFAYWRVRNNVTFGTLPPLVEETRRLKKQPLLRREGEAPIRLCRLEGEEQRDVTAGKRQLNVAF